MDIENSWATLTEIQQLQKAERKNTAKQLWSELSEEFRIRVLKLVLSCMENPQDVETCPTVTFDSEYGQFTLSPKHLKELTEVVSGMR